MGGIRILRVIGLFLAAGMPVHAVPGNAQQYMNQCRGWEGKQFSIEARIGGCTAAIQSRRWSGRNLAWAYVNRGIAYFDKEDYDRAITDYNEAIRLGGPTALRYNNRGNAYRAKKDYDRAFADYNDAIRLDPKFAAAYNGRCYARATLGRELTQALAYCQADALPGRAASRRRRN